MNSQEVTLADLEPPRFTLIGFNDVVFSTARTYVIKDIVPKGGLVVIWGAPKSGKSFLTTDMFLHVALGWDYRGYRVEQGTVVYIAAEGGGGVAKRLEAFRQEKLAESLDGEPPFKLLASRLDLVQDHEQFIRDITSQLERKSVAAVIVDTLNRTYSGSESNDADMTAYIKAADAIRQTFDCAVVLVHHCGLDTTRPRGHTSLLGALDAQIAIRRDAQDNIIALVEHMRDGEDDATWASTLRQVVVSTDEDGDDITTCVVEPIDEYEPPKRGTKRLSAQQSNALELLRRAINEAGGIPPACNHIPPNTHAVKTDIWRRYCDQGTIADSDNPDSVRKAFKRAAEGLQKAGKIGVWNDWVWIV